MFTLPTDFNWISPWVPIEDRNMEFDERHVTAEINSKLPRTPTDLGTIADYLTAELRREMPKRHRLADCAVVAIGRCLVDEDDVLFATDDKIAPLAVIHLTWNTESDPSWPYTVLYRNLDEWIAQMKRDSIGVRWANLVEGEE